MGMGRGEEKRNTGRGIENEWKQSLFSFLTYCSLTCFRRCTRHFTNAIAGPYLTVFTASGSYLHIT